MPMPFQILFGHTPGEVHRWGNKSWLLKEYEGKIQITIQAFTHSGIYAFCDVFEHLAASETKKP